MKTINVRFEKDETLSYIDVVCRASENDTDVGTLMRKITEIGAKKISVTDEGGNICIIPQEDIISVSVMGKQVSFKTADGTFFSQQTLQEIEKELYNDCFVRISRYEIVNINRIVKFDFTLSGTLCIFLEGGITTWASRRCIPDVRRKIFGKE